MCLDIYIVKVKATMQSETRTVYKVVECVLSKSLETKLMKNKQ